ncbi:MAG TPA: hypothetical protein DEB31_00395 [Clostridiales bacterium]|nr:hypothetical protein [Clostridiales bacterium]
MKILSRVIYVAFPVAYLLLMAQVMNQIIIFTGRTYNPFPFYAAYGIILVVWGIFLFWVSTTKSIKNLRKNLFMLLTVASLALQILLIVLTFNVYLLPDVSIINNEICSLAYISIAFYSAMLLSKARAFRDQAASPED